MLKIILKFLKYLICIPIIAYISIFILVVIYIIIFDPISIKGIVLGDNRYEIKRKKFCINNCYSIHECDSYEGKCYGGHSFYLIYDADKIIDIYAEDKILNVVFKKIDNNFKVATMYKCKEIDDDSILEECVFERYRLKANFDNYFDAVVPENKIIRIRKP